MLRVGVCEDETIWRKRIVDLIEDYFLNKGEPFLLKQYSSGEELLSVYEYFDIIFMDIEMPGIDGIETAKRIRQFDGDVEIIFLTSHDEMMRQAFQVKAFSYLNKDFKHETLEKCLESFFYERNQFFDVEIEFNNEIKTINTKDIIMIEATKNGSIVCCRNKEILSRNTLVEWEKLLGNISFYRCHRSYIVHLYCVKAIDKSIKLLNKYEAEVSRRNRMEFKNLFFEYLEKNAR